MAKRCFSFVCLLFSLSDALANTFVPLHFLGMPFFIFGSEQWQFIFNTQSHDSQLFECVWGTRLLSTLTTHQINYKMFLMFSRYFFFFFFLFRCLSIFKVTYFVHNRSGMPVNVVAHSCGKLCGMKKKKKKMCIAWIVDTVRHLYWKSFKFHLFDAFHKNVGSHLLCVCVCFKLKFPTAQHGTSWHVIFFFIESCTFHSLTISGN